MYYYYYYFIWTKSWVQIFIWKNRHGQETFSVLEGVWWLSLSFFHWSNSSLDILGNAKIKRSCLKNCLLSVIRDLSETSSRLHFFQGHSLLILVLLLLTVLSQWVPSKNPKKDCLRKGRSSSPFFSMSTEATHSVPSLHEVEAIMLRFFSFHLLEVGQLILVLEAVGILWKIF